MSGEVPERWSVKPLGEIADLIMGQSPPSSAVAETGDGLPFIQGNAEFGARHPTPRFIASTTPKVVREGDVLVSVRAPVGEVNIAEGPLCIGRGVGGIRAKDCDPDFLFYAVGGLSQTFARLSQGSTFDAINGKELRSIDILVPPLDEQRRIAEVLRSVDEAIAANEEQRKQSDAVLSIYRRTVLSHLVVDPVGDTKFGDVCALGRGFAFKSDDYVEEGILNFRVTNVGRHPSRMGEVKFLPFDFAEKFSDYLLEGDEIVLVMVGATVGKLGRVPSDSCPALLNQNMWTLVGKEGISKELLWHLSHVLIAEKITSIQGGAYSFLTKKDFLNHRIGDIGDPALSIHAEAMSTVERHSSSLRAEAAMLATIKHHLMDDLLSGRVRVPA